MLYASLPTESVWPSIRTLMPGFSFSTVTASSRASYGEEWRAPWRDQAQPAKRG